MFAGAYRGPTPSDAMPLDPSSGPGTAPAVASVLLLEHDTRAAMLTYRYYLSVAQRSFDRLAHLSRLGPESSWRLEQAAYGSAAAKLDKQEILLATLVQRLGYVPRIDPGSFH
jgi:hypothetical protein